MGVSLRAYQNYETHQREPRAIDLAPLAGFGIDLTWLLAGVGEMHRAGPPSLNEGALVEAMEIVEEWLVKNRRTMTPEKKVRVIAMIYAMAIEEKSEGKEIDAQKIGRILHLVA